MSNTPPNTQGTAPDSSQQPISPSPGEIDKMVASYLQKKGYKATEAIFARESKGDVVSLEDVGEGSKKENNTLPEVNNKVNTKTTEDVDQVMEESSTTPSETTHDTIEQEDLDVYDVSYKSLREWIENSLDWYKVNKKTFYYSYVIFILLSCSLNYDLFYFLYLYIHTSILLARTYQKKV